MPLLEPAVEPAPVARPRPRLVAPVLRAVAVVVVDPRPADVARRRQTAERRRRSRLVRVQVAQPDAPEKKKRESSKIFTQKKATNSPQNPLLVAADLLDVHVPRVLRRSPEVGGPVAVPSSSSPSLVLHGVVVAWLLPSGAVIPCRM